MNDNKFESLIRAARQEPAPGPCGLLHLKVLGAIRQQQPAAPVSLFESLGALFPRLGLAAACLITLCLAAEFTLSLAGDTDLTSGLAQLSHQWLFTANGL